MEVAWGCVQREVLVLLGMIPYIIQTFNLYQVTHYCKMILIKMVALCIFRLHRVHGVF